MFGMLPRRHPGPPSHYFTASLKKVMAKRSAKQQPPRVIEPRPIFDHETFLARGQIDLFGEYIWPHYDPATWPSRFHHKCNTEWCGYPNHPRTKPGTFRCGNKDCCSTFIVTPEMAAAVTVHKTRMRYNRKLHNLAPADSTILRGSAMSAMEARIRPRSPSLSSVATAPMPFVPNPLHPTATSVRRERRPNPSLPGGARAPGTVHFPEQQGPVAIPTQGARSVRRDYGPRPSLPGLVELLPFQESARDAHRHPSRPGAPPPNPSWI
ncbi:hypothetical protein FB451DRAFT_1366672 [Mycena latifolia]|nr:hypothetical protein FB451DRAFT_1366672 [Mycena latifolia]